MLLEFQTFVESLPAHLANRRDFASVLAHVIQQVLLLAEHVAAHVAFVLDFPGVNGNVLFQAVEPGKFPLANGAHEESGVVLRRRIGILHIRNGVFKKHLLLVKDLIK